MSYFFTQEVSAQFHSELREGLGAIGVGVYWDQHGYCLELASVRKNWDQVRKYLIANTEDEVLGILASALNALWLAEQKAADGQKVEIPTVIYAS